MSTAHERRVAKRGTPPPEGFVLDMDAIIDA